MAASSPADKATENDHGPCLKCCHQTSSHCKACVGIRLDTDTMHKAYFCGKTCQAAGWLEHKAMCKQIQAVKRLWLAGELLQKLFYIARKHTFDLSFDRVEKTDEKLHVYQTVEQDSGFFTSFPEHLGLTSKDKEAIMAHHCCGGAIMAVHLLLPKLLSGMCQSIWYKSYGTSMAVVRQRIVWHSPQGILPDDYNHEVVLLVLKAGGNYILDLAGAQYGYYAPIYPMDEWMKEWIPVENTSYHFDNFARAYEHGDAFSPGMTLEDKYVRLSMVNAYKVGEFVSTFGEGNKTALQEALLLKEEDWRSFCTNLTEFVDKGLAEFWESHIKFY